MAHILNAKICDKKEYHIYVHDFTRISIRWIIPEDTAFYGMFYEWKKKQLCYHFFKMASDIGLQPIFILRLMITITALPFRHASKK